MEKQNINKRRITALKIIVDEETCNSEKKTRDYMAKIFDMPELLEFKEVVKRTITIPGTNGRYTATLGEELSAALIEAGFDLTKIQGYKEEPDTKFEKSIYRAAQQIKKLTGISDDTQVSFQFTSYDIVNNVKMHYLLFELTTSGKSKTEIKGKHKENVTKLINYLRMHGAPVMYDCEWKFEGNRACEI